MYACLNTICPSENSEKSTAFTFNQSMLNAIAKKFPDSARQRCVVHKMDDVLSYVPSKRQEAIKDKLKALFS
ncbi:hypothetical protein A4R35_09330 [Thermogemmatispora tikiterensis]|uniref:Mutator family transposase n=1 Tax=Thermogemmatispora tikiterensis TaxID=1825093 RepID=A0A328VNJ0_9CHLR|nr:hypothetical protein A4R35_09330 [Thermogemmatispora tikiterensis]